MSVVTDFSVDTNPDAFGQWFPSAAMVDPANAVGWSYDTPYGGPDVAYNPDTGHRVHWDVGDWTDPASAIAQAQAQIQPYEAHGALAGRGAIPGTVPTAGLGTGHIIAGFGPGGPATAAVQGVATAADQIGTALTRPGAGPLDLEVDPDEFGIELANLGRPGSGTFQQFPVRQADVADDAFIGTRELLPDAEQQSALGSSIQEAITEPNISLSHEPMNSVIGASSENTGSTLAGGGVEMEQLGSGGSTIDTVHGSVIVDADLGGDGLAGLPDVPVLGSRGFVDPNVDLDPFSGDPGPMQVRRGTWAPRIDPVTGRTGGGVIGSEVQPLGTELMELKTIPLAPLADIEASLGVPWGASTLDPPTGGAFTEAATAGQDVGPDVGLELQPLNQANASPALLSELRAATLSEGGPNLGFNMDMIPLDEMPAGARAGLSDLVGDLSNLSIGAEGIGLASNKFASFFKQRGVDLIVGQMLMPFFQWIDKSTDSPWYSRAIQLGLGTMGLIGAGDPFGLIAAPIGWAIQEYERQRRRLKDDDDPEADQGKKFGYVREGKTWYPAILTEKMRDEGWLGSNKTEIRMAYGTDLRWKQEKGTNKWVPYFEDGNFNMKDFHVWDSEVDNTRESGKLYGEMVDPLRDFYFMSEDDTDAMLRGMAGGDTFYNAEKGHVFTAEEQAQIQQTQKDAYAGFAPHAETTWQETWDAVRERSGDNRWATKAANKYEQMSGYVDSIQDLRSALDFMQDYRYSDAGQINSTNLGENEFEGSRTFRRSLNDSGYLGVAEDELNGFKWNNGFFGSRPKGWTAEDVRADGEDKFRNQDELLVLTDIYVQSINDLYDAQKGAGTAMGFDKLYGKAPKEGWAVQYHEDSERSSAATGGVQDPFTNKWKTPKDYAWALYQDNAWEFGALDTSEQLHDALELIEESGDPKWAGTQHFRNSQQRSYLGAKAYARYLGQKVDSLGGTPYMGGQKGTWLWEGNVTERWEDKSRVQLGQQTMIDWGRNPMYSELDDGPIDWAGYGGIDWNFVLHDAGILSDDPALDPDYVAGRFRSVDEFHESMQPQADNIIKYGLFYDEVAHMHVLPGDQTAGTIWDPDSSTYQAPPELQPLVPWILKDGQYVQNPYYRFDDFGPKPGTDTVRDIGTPTSNPDAAGDLDAGGLDVPHTAGDWGDIDATAPLVPEVPAHMEIGPDGVLQYTQEYIDSQTARETEQEAVQHALDEAFAAGQAAAADADDAADAAAAAVHDAQAAAAPALPAETYGATHVHDTPAHDHFADDGPTPAAAPVAPVAPVAPAWTPQRHEHVTYAAQPSISVPLAQVAADIAQGTT